MGAILIIGLLTLLAAAGNSIAGGGTFVAFPALTHFGALTEKAANIACTIGLLPGSLASILAVRGEVAKLPRGLLLSFTLISLAGGAAGSLLLLHTSDRSFHDAIPWLLLFATVVFGGGRAISRWAHSHTHRHRSLPWTIGLAALLVVIAIYGGYFGAGAGVLTLAALSLVGLPDLRTSNVLKVVIVIAANFTAAIVFLFGPVAWRYVLPMMGVSSVGGFAGMHWAQRLPEPALRLVILTIAILLTAAYFWQVYG